MESLLRDLRYGLRALRKAPAFTAVAILALGLGIGANTAIFSIADAFLLKPINLPGMEHLVVLLEQSPGETGEQVSAVSPADFTDWQQQSKTLESLTAWMWDSVNITGEGAPERVDDYRVMANFFSLCGSRPMLGRTFVADENQPGSDNVVVLSYGLWLRRYGSNPQIVGQTIHIDGLPHTVIGVMPKSFNFPVAAGMWLPLALAPKVVVRHDWRGLFALGRPKQGVTTAEVSGELNGIAAREGEAYPLTNRGWRVAVVSIRRFAIGNDAHDYTVLLLAAVGFVLLLVCANIANLQLVRGAGRVKEIAIRSALGGSRRRIVRQLATESVLLGLGGAVLGVLVAYLTVRLVLLNMPADVSRTIAGWDSIHVDARALGFTLVVAILAGILAGLLPAYESTRFNLSGMLNEGGRSGSSARGRHRVRNFLVIIQVALAIVMLGGAGLLVRAFNNIRAANETYSPRSLLTMTVNLPGTKYPKGDQQRPYFDQVLARLAALPGIEGAATTTILPYANGNSSHVFSIEGRPWSSPAESQTAFAESVSPNFFRLMGIPLLQGREFSDQDGPATTQVAIISEGLMRAYWPNSDPLGHRVNLGSQDDPHAPWLTIVGVAGNVVMDWENPGSKFAIYRPYRQFPRAYATIVLRTLGNPDTFASAAYSAFAAVDSDISPMTMKPMAQVIEESMVSISYVAALMSALGILALGLAAVGVYGVMAFTVTESTHEVGIRMAMGALPGNVMRLFVARGMLLTATGVAIGVPISIWLARVLGAYMSSIGAADLISLTGAVIVLGLVALIACLVPARRATRVDPMVALRHE
jgi:putative ABC transport system permease protein